MWIAPVFDRTLSDCEYGNPKGSLNVVTMNRIEGNIEYLMREMESLSVNIPLSYGHVNGREWRDTDYLYRPVLQEIYTRTNNLKNTGIMYDTTPGDIADAVAFVPVTLETINDVEKILYDVKQLVDGMHTAARIEGNFTLGPFYQHQYVRFVRR